MSADAPEPDFREALGPALAGALERKGYTTLTPVQLAVLDPALAGRDLRITSQTGSGKTLAIGFTLRDLVAEPHAVAERRRASRARSSSRRRASSPTRSRRSSAGSSRSWPAASRP